MTDLEFSKKYRMKPNEYFGGLYLSVKTGMFVGDGKKELIDDLLSYYEKKEDYEKCVDLREWKKSMTILYKE